METHRMGTQTTQTKANANANERMGAGQPTSISGRGDANANSPRCVRCQEERLGSATHSDVEGARRRLHEETGEAESGTNVGGE